MADTIIELNHVVKRFGKQAILEDVNLRVQSGEIVGLIGPSGAGKSTVIKTALGMEVTDGGFTRIFNESMPNRILLGRIGYMAQTDALYDTLTGRENLNFYAKMKGISKRTIKSKVTHVAQVVDLSQDLDKRVTAYSGGMRRRLSLAIALLGNPELLILDEPTVGIDPALRRQIWQELQRLREEGHAILITTHVMDEAELVDKVALLLHGNIIAFDRPATLEKQYHVSSIEDVFLTVEEAL